MKKTRRTFLKNGMLYGAGFSLLGSGLLSCTSPSEQEEEVATDDSPKSLRILILGGTSFLGPHQVAYALERGHKVSIFTRGRTQPTVHKEAFEHVEHLIGDRVDNLTALEGKEWDVVIDNSGRDAEWTQRSADLLKDSVGYYLYTSSTGVYYPYLGNDIDETTELLQEEPTEIEDEDMKLEYWYGVMKTQSEMAARQAFGKDRTIVVRPTYMIGPGDKTDRFIYWPVRLARGGEILVPGKKDDRIQYIDVRDVAEWMIRLAEAGAVGSYNAVGPENTETVALFTDKLGDIFDIASTFVHIEDYDFLKEHEIPYLIPWVMPEGNNYGSSRINNQKSIQNGLSFRSLATSVKDIHAWWYSDALTDERRAKFEQKEDGLLLREAAILEAWKITANR